MKTATYNYNARSNVASMKRYLNGKHHPLHGDVATRNLFAMEDRRNLMDEK